MIFILDRINVNGGEAQIEGLGQLGVLFAARMGFNTVVVARAARTRSRWRKLRRRISA
jgi:hypothetical protein